MKQLISIILFFTLISFVFGQGATQTMTPSMTFTNSPSQTISMTMTGTIMPTPSMTMTMSTSMSMSWTVSTSQSMSWSMSSSWSPSYTISPSNSIIRYFAPINIANTCTDEKSFACISWSRNVVGVSYESFNIKFGIFSSTYRWMYSTTSTFYILTELQPGTDYAFYIQGVSGQHMSAWSAPFVFTTVADFRDGVNNIVCSLTTERTVVCNWNNGVNTYSLIRASLYCPMTSTTRLTKLGIRDAQTSTILTGVPNKSTTCRVDFRIKYANFTTQKWSAGAWMM